MLLTQKYVYEYSPITPVGYLCLSLFPHLEEVRSEDEWVIEVRPGEISCPQFNFTVLYEEMGDKWGLFPQWGVLEKNGIEKEKALAILHEHIFGYKQDF